MVKSFPFMHASVLQPEEKQLFLVGSNRKLLCKAKIKFTCCVSACSVQSFFQHLHLKEVPRYELIADPSLPCSLSESLVLKQREGTEACLSSV